MPNGAAEQGMAASFGVCGETAPGRGGKPPAGSFAEEAAEKAGKQRCSPMLL